MPSRLFNVKNDANAEGKKVIWDEEINCLQPAVISVLDQLRGGQEVIIPLNCVDPGFTGMLFGLLLYYLFIIYAFCKRHLYGYFHFTTPKASNADYNFDEPLLVEHKESLTKIWKNIKTRSIITARRTLRKLAEGSKHFVYTLKKIKRGKKIFYILNEFREPAERKKNVMDSKREQQLEKVYQVLTKSLYPTGYTTYYYQQMELHGFAIHVTSETDATLESVKFELKAVKDIHGIHYPKAPVAYSTALQCHFGGVNEIIFAFYTDAQITLKLFTLGELSELAENGGWSVKNALDRYDKNLKNITSYITNHRWHGETVTITKKDGKLEFKS